MATPETIRVKDGHGSFLTINKSDFKHSLYEVYESDEVVLEPKPEVVPEPEPEPELEPEDENEDEEDDDADELGFSK